VNPCHSNSARNFITACTNTGAITEIFVIREHDVADVELWLGLSGAVLITTADSSSHFEAALMKYFSLHHNNSMAIKLVS
jgi:hypothetical protein